MGMEEADIQKITEAVAASVRAGLVGMLQAVVQREMQALRLVFPWRAKLRTGGSGDPDEG